MKNRILGNTGISVSPISFGSLTMSPLQHNFSAEQGGDIIAFGAAHGINLVDTAQYYNNYPMLAEGVKRSPIPLVIASKSYAYTAQMAIDAVDQARRGIGRDYIDIFMLHEQESEHTIRGHMEALDALYTLKAQGIIGAVGISTHFVAGVQGAEKYRLDIVHPMLNVKGLGICDGSRSDMEQAVQSAYKAGTGVYTMKAFGGGNLYAQGAKCLEYAFSFPYAHSVALGMKSYQEVLDNISFLQTGGFTSAYSVCGKHIHIEEYCTGCGKCVEKCSQNALYLSDNFCHCNPAKCLLCGYCSGVCPDFAIKIL